MLLRTEFEGTVVCANVCSCGLTYNYPLTSTPINHWLPSCVEKCAKKPPSWSRRLRWDEQVQANNRRLHADAAPGPLGLLWNSGQFVRWIFAENWIGLHVDNPILLEMFFTLAVNIRTATTTWDLFPGEILALSRPQQGCSMLTWSTPW